MKTFAFPVFVGLGGVGVGVLGDRLRGSDSSVQPLCNYGSTSIPCYSLYSENNFAFEVDLNVATPATKSQMIASRGSTHEMAADPRENFWVTHQASDQLTRVDKFSFEHLAEEAAEQVNKKFTQEARSNGTEDIKGFRTFNLYFDPDTNDHDGHNDTEVSGSSLTSSASGSLGVHQLLFPKHSQKNKSSGYMTLEFFNNTGGIGVWNWDSKSEQVPVKVISVPLEDEKTGWSCVDRSVSLQERTKLGNNCPTGAHPHTVAEDGDGNLWVTLKNVGAIARLRNPDLITDFTDAKNNWRIYDLSNDGTNIDPESGSGPLPFYVQTDGRDTVWFNSITTGQIGVIKKATQEVPLVPVLFEVSIEEESDLALKDDPIFEQGTTSRPGAFQVIHETGDVLLTVYNKYGSVVIVRDPAVDELEALIEDTYDGDASGSEPSAVSALILNSTQGQKYIKSMRVTEDDAFLHMDYGVQENGLLTLWLAASSNDFVGVDTRTKDREVQAFRVPGQADTLIKITDFDPSKDSHENMSHNINQIIVAPTQASWIHRVMVLPSREKGVRDGSRVIATELYSDRLLIVEQSEATKKAFRKKE